MSGTEVAETVEKTDSDGTTDNSPSSDGDSKSFMKDILKVPCMRSSFLNGYVGMIVGGLGTFFYTSNIKMGAHCAVASYWIVATGSWVTCRYKLYKENKFWSDKIQNLNEARMKKDEYNIPEGVKKLNEKIDESDKTPEKHG